MMVVQDGINKELGILVRMIGHSYGSVVCWSQWSYVGHIVILAVDWSRKWAAGPTKDFSRAVADIVDCR